MIIRPPQPPFTEAEWTEIRWRFLRFVFAMYAAVGVAGFIWSWLHAV